jgi:hypothetical protein
MKHRGVALAAAVLAGLGVAAVASGNQADPSPVGVVPSGIPESNVHFGDEVVVWGNEDEYVEHWNKLVAEYEAKAQAALESGETSEYESYIRFIDRLKQDIEALCGLPETTVC